MRKLNLTKDETIVMLADMLEHMEDTETIEIEYSEKRKRYKLTIPDEVMEEYENAKRNVDWDALKDFANKPFNGHGK